MRHAIILSGLLLTSAFLSNEALAQAPPPPPPPPLYTGGVGGGFALTSGNTDTANYNLTFTLVRDPKTKNVIKTSAMYLRGTQSKVLNLDRASATFRDEYSMSKRTFLFGQQEYVRDTFKDIVYLLAPTGGVGYKLVANDRTALSFSGGAGGIWESNSGQILKKSGSLGAGESFSQKVSSTAVVTQTVASLWKTNDFADSYTNFAVGLTTSIAKRLELKVELQDSYKNKPPQAGFKKNDTAFITAFVVKF
jgi:putative salt-induced outer membrane protein YdiY